MDIEEKDFARALRRHHAARLKRARSQYWGRRSVHMAPLTPAEQGKVLNNPACCSSWCCGNPRKWLSELTIQERRQQQEPMPQLLQDGFELAAD